MISGNSGWYCSGEVCGLGGKSGPWSNAFELPGYLKVPPINGAGIDTQQIPNLLFAIHHASSSGDVNVNDASSTDTRTTILTITNELSNSNIGYGDILYTTTRPIQHVAMIVGWGPYLTSWQEVYQFTAGGTIPPHWCGNSYDLGNQCTQLSDSRTECCSIPYVVDHGNHFLASNNTWAAGPKPYYSLPWGAPIHDGSTFIENKGGTGMRPSASDNSWGFIDLPMTEISFSLSNPPQLVLKPRFECRTSQECNTPLR